MWMHLPPSCRSVPEAAPSTSDCDWLWDALASSALWRSRPMPAPFWRRACARVPWMTALCGAICEPSTAERGVDAWTSSLAATRASRSPMLASALVSMIRATCGPTSPGSSPSASPPGASSRTSQGTFPWASTSSVLTSRSLATALRRDSSARRRSARRISGSASSSWPTTTAQDAGGSRQLGYGGPSRQKPTLTDAIRAWPTPTAEDSEQSGSSAFRATLHSATAAWRTLRAPSPRSGGASVTRLDSDHPYLDLQDQVAMWRTPLSSDAGPRGSSTGEGLRDQTRLWPTPLSADSERETATQGRGNLTLPGASGRWATPVRRDHKGQDVPNRVGTPSLGHQVLQTPMAGGECSPDGPTSPRRLNARFSEWLMGWPEGWASAEPMNSDWSATAWSRSARRLLSLILSSGSMGDVA